MNQTREIIERAFRQYRPALAYSGGGDSSALLDIVCSLGHKPPIIFSDSQMEYNSSLEFVQTQAKRYGLPFYVAKAPITPEQCWQKYGYPMLGKIAARTWMQKHPAAETGFKIDVSACCRKMKIAPPREMIKKIGCNAILTGQRGAQDDRLRGMRAHKDGPICYLKQDKITQINPLLGWTDTMIRRYAEQHELPINPAKAAGAMTIGCLFCGGGAQFDNSGFRILRKINPEAWRHMLVDFKFAAVIIAIKYEVTLRDAEVAIEKLGGIEKVMSAMPHVFDFLRLNPLKGYMR
jgi:3'-phosphoadenosine 5'-phosphosulfate sulfotransferase (PAPS reductase)/FAD synthetase